MPPNGWTIDGTGFYARHNICGKDVENKPQYIEAHIGVCSKLDSGSVAPKPTHKGSMANKVEAKVGRPATMLVEFKDAQGNLLGSLVGARRTFSSGSSGYGCYGKVGAKGSSIGYYQVSANIVEVGTKPS